MKIKAVQWCTRIIICGLIGTLLPLSASAQPPLWKRQLGTSGYDSADGVAVDPTGNVYITGSTEGSLAEPNQGSSDAWVTKFNANGKILWKRQLGNAQPNFSYGIATDSAGNVYICGGTRGDVGGYSNLGAWVAKYNTNGKILWQRRLGTPESEYANGVAVDANGNIYVSVSIDRTTLGEGHGRVGASVAKYNSNGKLLWKQQLAPAAADFSNDIAVDANGNIYLSGDSDRTLLQPQQLNKDAWVAKYNTDGKLLWKQQLGDSNDNNSYGVAVDTVGNVYIGGEISRTIPGTYQLDGDAWVAKYNTDGKRLWKKQLGTATIDSARSVAVDTYSNVYISGLTDGALVGANRGSSDVWVAKYSPDGKLVWKQQLGSSKFDFATGVATDTYGSFYLTGFTEGALAGTNQGQRDAWIVKYPQTPAEQLNLQINTPAQP